MQRWPVQVRQWPTPAKLSLFQDQFDCQKFHEPSPIPLSSSLDDSKILHVEALEAF